ncbi:MAG TPA: hypothetical protein DIW31_03870, partial [Bacteroidales bacterium]|nr:hypothetical protein [Bacteroidales bacterium]
MIQNYSTNPMLNRLLAIVILFSLSGSCNKLYSQHAYKPVVSDPLLEPWRWKLMPELRGKGVRCIESSKDGSIWFGVDKGICRYDGISWDFYDTTNSKIVFPVNSIVDNNGFIIAGSEKGLSIFHNRKWKALFSKEKNSLLAVSCMKKLSDGAVLVGFSKGLIYIKNDKYTFLAPERNIKTLKKKFVTEEFIALPDNYLFENNSSKVDEIFEYSQDELWILMSQSTRGKIFKFNLNKAIEDKSVAKSEVLFDLSGNKLYRGLKVIRTKDNKTWIISSYHRSGIFT